MTKYKRKNNLRKKEFILGHSFIGFGALAGSIPLGPLMCGEYVKEEVFHFTMDRNQNKAAYNHGSQEAMRDNTGRA